jgi:hypothetical protein
MDESHTGSRFPDIRIILSFAPARIKTRRNPRCIGFIKTAVNFNHLSSTVISLGLLARVVKLVSKWTKFEKRRGINVY